MPKETLLSWAEYGDDAAYLAFLSFYGTQFDVAACSVSIPSCDTAFSKDARAASEAEARANRWLFVADPQGSQVNVASCYNFDSIQQLFRDTLTMYQARWHEQLSRHACPLPPRVS